MMTRIQAEAAGYTINTSRYPWAAYKGDRYDLTEFYEILTDREAALATVLRPLAQAASYPGGETYGIKPDHVQAAADALDAIGFDH